MEDQGLNKIHHYEGVFTTTNPEKIGVLLNTMLHNPNSALIIEPIINEYWIFYYGGASYPVADKEINHLKNEKFYKEENESASNVSGKWQFDIIKFDDPAQFFDEAMAVLNKIKNKNTIKVVIEQPDQKRKLHIYHKK